MLYKQVNISRVIVSACNIHKSRIVQWLGSLVFIHLHQVDQIQNSTESRAMAVIFVCWLFFLFCFGIMILYCFTVYELFM